MDKKVVIGLILFIWLGISAAQAQSDINLLTFEEAYRMMQTGNPALQKAHKEIEQKMYEKQQKQSLYMPRVLLNAEVVSMSDPLHLDLTPVGEAISGLYEALGNYGVFSDVPYYVEATGQYITLDQATSTDQVRTIMLETAEKLKGAEWDEVIQKKNFAAVSANFTWPVFAGGKIAAANKAAKVEINISEEGLRKTEGELLTELVTRYYGLVLAKQVSDVMKQKYEAMQKHYSDACKMHDEGIIARVELLSASVSLSEAEREYKNAERMVATVHSGLTATLAVENDSCFVPVSNLFINKTLPGIDYWKMQTKNVNPILKQIDYKKELVDIKTKVSKGNYLPSIALMGTYNLADYELSPYMPKWLVGAGMKWTLFDGQERGKEIKANKTQGSQVMYAQQKVQNDLNAYIVKLHNELNNRLFEITELETTLELAEEYCKSTEKAFKEGLKNSTAVAEALSKVTQVKALRLKAFYEYDITLSMLLQISGEPEKFMEYCSGQNTIIESVK